MAISGKLHTLLPSIVASFDLSPLINSICDRTAVVYVGAGASVPCGLPTWNLFLRECLERAQKSTPDPTRWEQTARLIREGDYLTSADLLQKEIGQALEHYVWDIFGNVNTPSPVHFAIARIPFSLAISTNYDRLLESAYRSRPNVWTWRDPAALFGALKHSRFSVVKVHGDVGNGPSLVLTKTQYRDLMHLNKSFNDCLTTLLSLRTFLFVGSSLRDHDLLRLMDNAKLTYGNDFGPHYAILFDDEVDNAFERLLQETYNINVIRCCRPEERSASWRTESVCSFLRVLSGKVSDVQGLTGLPNILESPTFSLTSASHQLLSHIVGQTGSDRGAIAFIGDFELPALYFAAQVERENPADIATPTRALCDIVRFADPRTLVPPMSSLGTVFLQGGAASLTVQRDNLSGHSITRTGASHSSISTHSEVQSVLACPIAADGRQVGILAIESFCKDAYTEDHYLSLWRAAARAGAIYTEYRHRNASTVGIVPYLRDVKSFQFLMDMSRALKPLELSYLLFEIDYATGACFAHYDGNRVKARNCNISFGFRFEEKSLVTRVLRERKAMLIPDAAEDLRSESPSLSAVGVNFFDINGSVFATPVRVGAYTATVLVCWSRSAQSNLKDNTQRIERLARLIANSPEGDLRKSPADRSAYRFISSVNENLAAVDNNESWSKTRREDPEFRRAICRAILRALIHDSCGLARVRLWEEVKPKARRFAITHSLTLPEATWPGNDPVDAYVGNDCDGGDPFCRYTIERSRNESLSMWQNALMLGEADANCPKLHKSPDGSWVVAPIVWHGVLIGFISADTHYPGVDNRPFEKGSSEGDRVFQSCAMDLAADILTTILRMNRSERKSDGTSGTEQTS